MELHIGCGDLLSILFGYSFNMRAEICDSGDEAAVARFRDSLRRPGAQFEGKDWAIGVDYYMLSIGREQLSIFSDAWSLDIEGLDELVQRVVRECELAYPPVA